MRKIGFKSDTRKAFLKSSVTCLIYYGRVKTTLQQAKEIRRKAEKLITVAKKNFSDYEEVNIQTKKARKDANGKRVKEKDENGKTIDVFDVVDKNIKKDNPGRLKARRKILANTCRVSEFSEGNKKKRSRKFADLPKK